MAPNEYYAASFDGTNFCVYGTADDGDTLRTYNADGSTKATASKAVALPRIEPIVSEYSNVEGIVVVSQGDVDDFAQYVELT